MINPNPPQVTRGLLEILVLLVPEENKDKMVYQDLLEKKEIWEVGDEERRGEGSCQSDVLCCQGSFNNKIDQNVGKKRSV